VKTKTAILAIFLTFTNLSLSADTAPDLPETKYVSEQNESNTPKKDKTRLYNFLLALAAVAVATTAIIVVSNNKGKHAHNN
jgi:hypothetical protein